MKNQSLLLILILLFISLTTVNAQNPLSGNYTINSASPPGPTNFQTFNALADSLNQNGVSGDVIVTVTPGSGPYNEQVIFNNIPGTGPNATITIEGSGETITALTNTNDRHIIRLTNLQYFTINNLKIVRDSNSTSGFFGIHIYQTGNHITLSNNEVDMTGSTSTLVGGYVASGSETSILNAGDFHNINIMLNKTSTGGYGASVFGLSAANRATNIVVSGNEFISFNDNGVYLRETDGAVVSGNYFDKLTTNISGWNAIQLAQAANINGQIFNNEIKVSQTNNGTMQIRGIYLFNGTGHKVYNNIIHDVNLTSGNFTAIEVRQSSIAPEIYFNTINLDHNVATTGNLFGFAESLSNTNSILRNNLINITQSTSGVKAAIALAASSIVASAINSDYNWFWVPGGNIGYRTSTTPLTFPTLGDWQNASGEDLNSINIDPVLITFTHPVPTNIAGNDAGIAAGGITTDFLGVTRGTPPDIGAIEFGGCPPNAPNEIIGDTLVCINSTGVTYSITPVSGATGYTWSVPADATITQGQGSTLITVDFGTQSGAVTVTADDSCGSSTPATLLIDIETQLQAPANITGANNVCAFETMVNYTADTIQGAQSYNWTVPSGATVVSGQGTSSVVVDFGNSAGDISVEAINSCGASPATILNINVNPLPAVSLSLPVDTVCHVDIITLSGGNPANGTYSGPGVTGGTFVANIAGPGMHTITYSFTDSNGCTDSASANIFVEICIGLNEPVYSDLINIYPNPFNDFTIIDLKKQVNAERINIYNSLGETVYTKEKPLQKIIVERGNLQPGIYFVEIISDDKILLIKKMVVY